jgi:alpha-tubulin suppressor-like RCC1 family protein
MCQLKIPTKVPVSAGVRPLTVGGQIHKIKMKKQGNAVATSEEHTFVVTPEGRVVCWGRNGIGQCDVPPDLEMLWPSPVDTVTRSH